MTPADIEFLFPITSVLVHRGGHLTVQRSARFPPPKSSAGNRKQITKLSKKSLKELNHTMQCTNIEFCSMATLTYPRFYPRGGKETKKDFAYMLRWFKKFSDNYLWFLEFQKRGAPHFHLLLETSCITPAMRVGLAFRWIDRVVGQEYWWSNVPAGEQTTELRKFFNFAIGDSVWELIKSPDGARRYVAKYAQKPAQKQVPLGYSDVGRFWGATADVRRIDGVEVDCDEKGLRLLLEKQGHIASSWDFVPKHLWGVMRDSH